METLEGRTIHVRYQIQERIGRGGMATVYKAWDPELQRSVAIKFLNGDKLETGSVVESFLREARLMANLQHPHILPVHDSGVLEGRAFFVMRLVDGGTLHDAVRRLGRLPDGRILEVLDQVAAALDYAHRAIPGKRVVHQDVKPSNILLDGGWTCLLADFGISKVGIADAALSLTGLGSGTPSYMAPEQCEFNPHIDGRADLYALGVVAFELLTGELPFQAQNTTAILYKHVHEPPCLPELCRGALSPHVEAVLLKALAKKPDDRYQSGAGLVQALGEALDRQRAALEGHVTDPARAWDGQPGLMNAIPEANDRPRSSNLPTGPLRRDQVDVALPRTVVPKPGIPPAPPRRRRRLVMTAAVLLIAAAVATAAALGGGSDEPEMPPVPPDPASRIRKSCLPDVKAPTWPPADPFTVATVRLETCQDMNPADFARSIEAPFKELLRSTPRFETDPSPAFDIKLTERVAVAGAGAERLDALLRDLPSDRRDAPSQVCQFLDADYAVGFAVTYEGWEPIGDPRDKAGRVSISIVARLLARDGAEDLGPIASGTLSNREPARKSEAIGAALQGAGPFLAEVASRLDGARKAVLAAGWSVEVTLIASQPSPALFEGFFRILEAMPGIQGTPEIARGGTVNMAALRAQCEAAKIDIPVEREEQFTTYRLRFKGSREDLRKAVQRPLPEHVSGSGGRVAVPPTWWGRHLLLVVRDDRSRND